MKFDITFEDNDTPQERQEKLNKLIRLLPRMSVGAQNTTVVNAISSGGGAGVAVIAAQEDCQQVVVVAGVTQFVTFPNGPYPSGSIFSWWTRDANNFVVDVDVAIDGARTGFTISNAIANCTLSYFVKEPT